MISCLHRSALAATLAVALAAPAQAVPLIGIGASAGGYVNYSPSLGLGFDLDGSAQLPFLDLTANAWLAGTRQNAEIALRKEVSFLPMLSVRPGLGWHGTNFWNTGTELAHAPQASVLVSLTPILSPIWFEGSLNASYLLGPNLPVAGYMVGGYFAFLPIASLGLRLRGYQDLSGGGRDFTGYEAGLRLSI